MRQLLVIWLAGVLAATVAGCGHAVHDNELLATADGLMHDHPDSALAIIQTVDPDSLDTEAD